ncbi:MAG: ArsR family transcriptional regulator [Comamonadaceae bacterium]|nr:MAG: ArsR family transcriptional regulator [Comamonadaceae bacterium]
MEENEVVRALAALAHPARLQVFRALVVVGEQGLTPGTMAEALSMPAATLSFHLKELVHAGLVTQERSGRNIVYRSAFDRMNAVLGYLTAHCCQGAACLDPTATACCAPATATATATAQPTPSRYS